MEGFCQMCQRLWKRRRGKVQQKRSENLREKADSLMLSKPAESLHVGVQTSIGKLKNTGLAEYKSGLSAQEQADGKNTTAFFAYSSISQTVCRGRFAGVPRVFLKCFMLIQIFC